MEDWRIIDLPRVVELSFLILMPTLKVKAKRKEVPPMLGENLLPSGLLTNLQGVQKP